MFCIKVAIIVSIVTGAVVWATAAYAVIAAYAVVAAYTVVTVIMSAEVKVVHFFFFVV